MSLFRTLLVSATRSLPVQLGPHLSLVKFCRTQHTPRPTPHERLFRPLRRITFLVNGELLVVDEGSPSRSTRQADLQEEASEVTLELRLSRESAKYWTRLVSYVSVAVCG